MKTQDISDKELKSIDKAVVYPVCMIPCLDYNTHGFYKCEDCSDCQVSTLKSIASEHDYETLLVGTRTMSKTLLGFIEEGHRVKSVLGILCREEIEEKKEQLGKHTPKDIFDNYDTYVIPKVCVGKGSDRVTINMPTVDIKLFKKKLSELDESSN